MTSLLTRLDALPKGIEPDEAVELIQPVIILSVKDAYEQYPDHQCFIMKPDYESYWKVRGGGVTPYRNRAYIYTVKYARDNFIRSKLRLWIIPSRIS